MNAFFNVRDTFTEKYIDKKKFFSNNYQDFAIYVWYR